jgi:hypothetical protein
MYTTIAVRLLKRVRRISGSVNMFDRINNKSNKTKDAKDK